MKTNNRLDEIEEDMAYLAGSDYNIVTLNISDYRYIIEKARRCEQAESDLSFVLSRLSKEGLELLARTETLGIDKKTGKTKITYTGMLALTGLNKFDEDKFAVYYEALPILEGEE